RRVAFTELLENKLPPHLLASLPRAIDFVGDIAIIEIPPELEAHKALIGEAILKAHKKVQTVLAKAGAVSGTYRLREFSVIAGKSKTETIHKEYGCQFYVDISKAYFSPRLSYEHNRVASLVKDNETVIDMFSGVGPFAILIAKTHENVKVYAIDINPYAIEFLQKNIRLNRVEGKIHPILGDAKEVVEEKLSGIADRVIMNLPEKAIEFVDVACKAIKPTGGIIHFYTFVSGSDSLENLKLKLIGTVENCGRKVDEILFSRFVRATAPYEWQAVLDAKIH
ncbi:MAG: class I SAM-dependent methyltransferase family protein, partial [Candidatus Bathyarchaeia archaeon]